MKKKTTSLLLAACIALALTACGGSGNSGTGGSGGGSTGTGGSTGSENSSIAQVQNGEAQAPNEAGFEEIPIFEDEEVGFMNVSAVYFQPVPMDPGNENIEGYDMHLECDVSALDNTLGYGLGDWIPYLTVDYDVVGSNGQSAASGTFMAMSASDGPHYGANIALPNADTYSLTFTFHSPAENGYLIHSDAETGPGGLLDQYFGNGNLTVTYDGWEYTPMEW